MSCGTCMRRCRAPVWVWRLQGVVGGCEVESRPRLSGDDAAACRDQLLHSCSPTLDFLDAVRQSLETTCTTAICLAMLPFRANSLHGLTDCLVNASRLPIYTRGLPRPLRSPAQCFSTTTRALKKFEFTQKPDEAIKNDDTNINQEKATIKPSRKNAGKTSSLRSIAVEAQRSRTFVKSRGRQRFVDPDAETKV